MSVLPEDAVRTRARLVAKWLLAALVLALCVGLMIWAGRVASRFAHGVARLVGDMLFSGGAQGLFL